MGVHRASNRFDDVRTLTRHPHYSESNGHPTANITRPAAVTAVPVGRPTLLGTPWGKR